MRVLVILKANANSEAGVMPSKEDIERGIRFNEEMVKAGILKAADGLKPSKFGKRLSLRAHRKPSITDGPFAETKEQLGGYYLLNCKDLDEAIKWAAKIPGAKYGSIEVRPIWEFGE